jgi:hypothetical protein
MIKLRVFDIKQGHYIIPWESPDDESYDDIDLTYSNSGTWHLLGGEEMTPDKYVMEQSTGFVRAGGEGDIDIYDGDMFTLGGPFLIVNERDRGWHLGDSRLSELSVNGRLDLEYTFIGTECNAFKLVPESKSYNQA